MSRKHPEIQKSSGEVVPFDDAKFRASLMRSGASEEEVKIVSEQVKAALYPGIPTEEIYGLAYSLLKRKSHRQAGRYKLKQALLELGPSGFPFERFVGALLVHQGFVCEYDQVLPGKCVHHELDLIAQKEEVLRYIECKFHQQRGQKTDVKVSLYLHSRFRDLDEARHLKRQKPAPPFEGWLFTNTRFSDDALTYGRCAGMHLVSWDHPSGGSLKEMIESSGIFPITCLSGLTADEKRYLMEHHVVTCCDLDRHAEVLAAAGIGPERLETICNEASEIRGAR
ncbi:MAG: ATPase [Bacteroidia bacterium]